MIKRLLHFSPTAFILFAVYCAIIAGLQQADIYHRHFFESGAHIALYNLARLGFMASLGWLIYFAGWAALRAAAGARAIQTLTPLSRCILGFFAGAGIWHMGLFIIGALGLYRFPVAVFLSVSVFLASLPHLSECLREIKSAWRITHKKAAGALLLATCAFIAAKIIYPGGWHDYFVHYFHFYRDVTESGSIAPNAVWYHFFYCKGAGLYFLSMLLTDPLAPQLVAGSFILMAALVVYALTRRAAGGVWPLVACILYLGLQVYIRGSGYGSWGHLPKMHEMTAALTLALLWCAITFPEDRAQRRLWLAAMMLMIASAIMLTLSMGFFLGALFGLLFVYAWVRKQQAFAWGMFICGTVCGVSIAAMMAINYAYTGLPTDHILTTFWPYLSLEKLRHWGVLVEMAMLTHDSIGVKSDAVPLAGMLDFLRRCLRLDLLLPLFALAGLYAVCYWKRRYIAFTHQRDAVVYLALIAALIVFALAGGRNEPVSFYRMASFAFAPMLCLAMLCIAYGTHVTSRATKWLPVLALVIALIPAYARYKADDLNATATNSWRFVTGSYSIDDALSRQRGLPGDARADGVIHPAARAAYGIAGPNTRIWTFNPYTYCMLPDCRMESYFSFRLSPNAQDILFERAEVAKRILQIERLDYFLITPSLGIRDPLPLSELFSPDHIGKYMAVAWTDGDSALLTWPDEYTTPISKEWLARYREAVAQSETVKAFPMRELQAFFKQTKDAGTMPLLPWMKKD